MFMGVCIEFVANKKKLEWSLKLIEKKKEERDRDEKESERGERKKRESEREDM